MTHGHPKTYTATWLGLAGSLGVLSSYWLYGLGTLAFSQVGLLRTLGIFAAVAFVYLAVAAGLAALLCRFDSRRIDHVVQPVVFLGAVVNAVLIGMMVFFQGPMLAPWWAKGAALAVLALSLVRYGTYTSAARELVNQAIARSAAAAVLIALLPTPVVVWAALNDRYQETQPPLPSAGDTRPAGPRRVVLVTFDGLRMRSTSLGGSDATRTPHLAALAQESLWFSRAHSASDATQLSVGTILTGVPAGDFVPHIENKSGFIREGQMRGLAGYLKAVGYRTLFATMLIKPGHFGMADEYDDGYSRASFFHTNRFNTRQFVPFDGVLGWMLDEWRGERHQKGPPVHEMQEARETFDHGLRLMRGEEGRTFLWLHLGLPHAPYFDVPPSEVTTATQTPGRYRRVTEGDLRTGDAAALRGYEGIYERYVRFADAELGRFIAAMKRQALWNDTLFVFTSDHGETFEMPGHLPHGNGLLTEDVTHVPLLIHRPGQQDGQRVDAHVSHEDIVPTVLDQVLSQVPAGFSGRALPEADAERVVFSWNLRSRYVPAHRTLRSIAAYQGRYKYMLELPEAKERLYDLVLDPRARKDVAQEGLPVLTSLRNEVRGRFPSDAPAR